MNETYLQWIWSNKRIPFHKIRLTDGRPLIVHQVGKHNLKDEGPDFHLGSFTVDSIMFVGNIEIHVRSSDWFTHKHHLDSRYHGVILHVVYEDDKPLIIDGKAIPTLELKDLIDWEHFNKFQTFSSRVPSVVCQHYLTDVPKVFKLNMLEKALHQRLTRKAMLLIDEEVEQAHYQLLAAAFGGNRNKEGFMHLASRVPIKELRGIQKEKIISLLKAESGVFSGLNCEDSVWKYRMVRPANSPVNRVTQFSHLIAYTSVKWNIADMKANEIIQVLKKEYGTFNATLLKSGVHPLSNSFIEHVIINTIPTFLFYLSELRRSDHYQEKAIEVLQLLNPETNSIVTKWKQWLEPKSAFDTQAILSLDSQYCSRKKCLSCEVGNHILKR